MVPSENDWTVGFTADVLLEDGAWLEDGVSPGLARRSPPSRLFPRFCVLAAMMCPLPCSSAWSQLTMDL